MSICIVENEVMLFTNVQRNVVNIYNTCRFCYQSITWKIWKQGHLVSIGIMRMDLNVSYYKNGHNLSLDPTPCFLIPLIIKSYKVVTTETQALVDYGAFACFTNKELVWQHKLSSSDETKHTNTNWSYWWFSLGLVTQETKASEVTIASHTKTLSSMSFHP
jgi:hypothetical protein